MLGISLGRRFERLLFFSAPLSIATLVILFIAISSTLQSERLNSRCYLLAAGTISDAEASLTKEWNKQFDKKEKLVWDIGYIHAYRILFIYELESACEEPVRQRIVNLFKTKKPSEIARILRDEGEKLRSGPINYLGIEIPEKATVRLLGTDIKIGLATTDQILKIALAPILALWLGSLYNTRYRETLVIGQATHIAELFPHVINVYPAFTVIAPKKRNRFAPYERKVVRFIYCIIRIALLSIFILPPVSAYIASLILAPFEFSQIITWAICGVVGTFAFASLIVETLPWAYRRIFPAPELVWND